MKIRLKDLRQSHGMFQSDMAALLGLNQSTVSRLELHPVAELTFPQYNALCERFGQEDVMRFIDDGTEENRGRAVNDSTAMEVIKQQTEVLAHVLRKQTEQTDRLLSLLEQFSSYEQGNR